MLEGIVIDLKYPLNYEIGYIETDNGTKFFFHEDKQVFKKFDC